MGSDFYMIYNILSQYYPQGH